MKPSQRDLPGLTAACPVLLEVTGAELQAVLAKLRADGAFVWRMDAVCQSDYKLHIHWPATCQTAQHHD